MSREQKQTAAWKPWVTWGLCWCAFTLGLVAWKVAGFPVARGRRMTLYSHASAAGQPFVQITARNELITDGRRYRTLVAWTQAVSLPGGHPPLVIEADPRAKVHAVSRLVQWLRSRGADQVVVWVRNVDAASTSGPDDSADAGQT